MLTNSKKVISLLLSILIILSTVYISPLVANATDPAARDIEITLAADAVSNNLDLTGFSDKLKNELNTTFGIATDKIHITTVDSSAANSAITWNSFDHTNNAGLAVDNANSLVSYYYDYYGNLYHNYHIIATANKLDFYGYGSPAFKDFLLSKNTNANNKIFQFSIDEANTSYHSGEGAGFLFNAKYTYTSSSDRKLSCYFVLSGQSYVTLYKMENIQVSQFMNDPSYNMAAVASYVNTPVSKWGGTVTLLKSVMKPGASSGTLRYLKLVASASEVSFYQFTNGTYNTVQYKMIENFALPTNFGEFSFGPIASYSSHSCPQDTRFTFDNIKLTEDTSVGFAEIARSTSWQYPGSLKTFVNIDNDGVADFATTDKLSSILYYTMLNNAHYIGWGMNNTISVGGYTSVKAQSDGFVTRNNGKGTFINRSTAGTITLDDGVKVIAAYIAGQLSSVPEIANPTLRTTFSGLNVTCTATDTETSEGNAIGGYQWKYLDIATGVWTNKSENTNASSFTFPINTYSMVGLRIQDSVTSQWSDYSYAYIATVATVQPVSQFVLDYTTLMPDSSISSLNTGTIVNATDNSYLPNGGTISDYEWTVYDKNLTLLSTFTKTYTSVAIPASITFDFLNQASGTYTIKLRTKNGSSGWSNYYSQQVMIYKESTAVSISTSNNTASSTIYTGTVSIPFIISSTGGNITSYRLIKVLPNGTVTKGDWTKVDAASVSTSSSITNTSCDVYVQAVDAVGNSKTGFVGTYLIPPTITATYEGGNTAYPSNTLTNKNVILKSSDSSLEYSTDDGSTWNTFVSPKTVTESGTYIFRYTGDTVAANQVSFTTNINKTFGGSVSGFANNSKYSTGITPIISNSTAMISKDGGTATAFISGTAVTASGSYALVLTDTYGNTGTYAFIIDKTTPTINATGNITDWTSGDVVLTISTTAGLSGIQSVTVTKNGDDETPENITGQAAFNAASNGTYEFVITNGAGVTASTTVSITNIDAQTPSVAISSIRSGLADYHYSSAVPIENDVVITLADSNNVPSGVTYYSSTDGTNWSPITGNVFTISNTDNAAANYYFKAVSGSGLTNQYASSEAVYIVKPVFTNDMTSDIKCADGSIYNGSWTNKT